MEEMKYLLKAVYSRFETRIADDMIYRMVSDPLSLDIKVPRSEESMMLSEK